MNLPFPDPPSVADTERFVQSYYRYTQEQQRAGLDYLVSRRDKVRRSIRGFPEFERLMDSENIHIDFRFLYWYATKNASEMAVQLDSMNRGRVDRLFVARWTDVFMDPDFRRLNVEMMNDGTPAGFGFGETTITFGEFLDRYCQNITREIKRAAFEKMIPFFQLQTKHNLSGYHPVVARIRDCLIGPRLTRRGTAADSRELNHWIRVLDNDDGGDATLVAITLRNLDTELSDPLITTREKIYDAVRRNQDKFTGTNGERLVTMLHGEPNSSGTTFVKIKYVIAVLPRINNILVDDQVMGFVKNPRPTRRAPISRLGPPIFARVAGMLYYPTNYAPIPIDRFAKSEQDAEREARARRLQNIRGR